MSQALTIPEALVWVERTLVQSSVRADIPWQLPVSALLSRSGERIEVADHAIDTAAIFTIIMSLIYGDRCNAAVVTDSVETADALFTESLLGAPDLTALVLGVKASKHFLNISRLDIAGADAILSLEGVLHDADKIPVGPLNSFERVIEAGEEQARRYSNALSWWKKLRTKSKPYPLAHTRLLHGIWMLNAVVRVGPSWVSANDEVGEDALRGVSLRSTSRLTTR